MRLRVQVQAADDPASLAYTLRYQKNGGGGYVAVPVGATSVGATPVIEAGDCTVSGSNTAGTSWAVSHPAAAAGDLLIFCVAWDDSTAVTSVTAPTGPNGETLTSIEGPIASNSTEVRCQAWYTVATGSWSAGTLTFTPGASESWSATVIKVPAGEFDAATPIGADSSSSSANTTDTTVDSPAYSAGASDGGGRLVWFAAVDADPLSATAPSGWTIRQRQDLGAVAHGIATRDAAVTDSESIASATWSIAGDSWASIAFIVRAPIVTNEVYVATSANVTAGGEATTQQLTAGSGSFTTGRMWDNENGSDSIDIGDDGYTELEWNLATQAPAAVDDYFDFRVYAGSSPLDTYTVTPRWTIGSAAGNYDGTLAETLSPSDALSSVLAGAAALAESTTVTDALGSTATFLRALSETISPVDAVTGGLSLGSSLAESVTPSDAWVSGSSFAATLAESVSAADSPSAVMARAGALAEALSPVDALASLMTRLASLSEAVSASDAPAAARVSSPALSETLSPSDSLSGGLSLLSALAEVAPVSDAVAAVQAALSSIAESVALVVAMDAEQQGVISVSMSEGFTVSDTVASALSALSALQETVTLSDQVVRNWITTAGLAETVAPSDVLTASRAIAAALSETAALVDSLGAIGVFSVQITEAAALIDAPQAAALLSAALSEAITPDDIFAAIAASYPGDPRRTFTVSGGRGLVVQAGDRVVVVTRNDRTFH